MPDHDTLGSQPRRPPLEPVLLGQTPAERVARDAQPVRAQGQRRPLVHRPHQRLGVLAAVACDPSLHDPRRERAAHRQGVARVAGRRWLTLTRAAPGERAQHGVDEGAHPGRGRGQGDGVVDRGESRHALEEGDLVRGHAQDHPHPRIERLESAARVRRQDPVEVTLPAERAVHQLGGERGVASLEAASGELGFEHAVGEAEVSLDTLEHPRRDFASRRGRSAAGHAAGAGPAARARPASPDGRTHDAGLEGSSPANSARGARRAPRR